MSNSDWALHDIENHSNLLTSTRTQNLCIHPTEIKDEQLLYSCLAWIQGSKTNNTSYIRGQLKVNVVVNICKLTLTQCLGYSSTLLMKLNPLPVWSQATKDQTPYIDNVCVINISYFPCFLLIIHIADPVCIAFLPF